MGSIIINIQNKIKLFCEISNTYETLQRGLMKRTNLPKNRGMIFIFPTVEIKFMWMKDTYIPLDILFLNEYGVIVTIKQNSIPFSEECISSNIPVKYAIECNAGIVREYNIKVGDKIID